jgi:hypothetical protein
MKTTILLGSMNAGSRNPIAGLEWIDAVSAHPRVQGVGKVVILGVSVGDTPVVV